MAEHMCEWVYTPDWKGGTTFTCAYPDCENKLSYKQTSQRLNEYGTLKKATEVLSAEAARRISNRKLPVSEHEELQAYADTLEGKDETRS